MKRNMFKLALAATVCLTIASQDVAAAGQDRPWLDASLDADTRAALILREMTDEEKALLLFGYFATSIPPRDYRIPEGAREGSAGFVPGVPRLGIPPQWQTDAGIGVATQPTVAVKRERTALPSGLATAATWDPQIAYKAGAMIGREARLSGFNVMLAGGVNLVRDPRNGRNFEYAGEDPLLAGTIVAAQIAGIQSNQIISTIKHFAMNDLETGRQFHDARIGNAAARMSDLLAFQLAIEKSDPGAVMCAYNRVGGAYACENQWLLTDILRSDWRWKGYVMSDWGGTHSTAAAANAGLEQETGWPFDKEAYFGPPLRQAVADGMVSRRRFDQMTARILRTMFAKGLFDHPVAEGPIDYAADAAVTRAGAEAGAVLLKNDRALLPLSTASKRIVVIGGHADRGVLSGGGSSQVYPVGGNAVPGTGRSAWPGPVVYYPSAPLRAMKALAPDAEIIFIDGADVVQAAKTAAGADAVVVFATQWTAESLDVPLALPEDQDRLITEVAKANPNLAVVLETGGPVLMPWAEKVGAILEAWYPGTNGGDAIANLLFGRANPSGKLPVTFPRSEAQLPRPTLPGAGLADDTPFVLDYGEGAAVGYKWYDRQGLDPLFPFGHGLSYTRFGYDGLKASLSGSGIRVTFRVTNQGQTRGADAPQLYVAPVAGGWEAPKRLGAFAKVDLAPGETRIVEVTIDPRLLAVADDRSGAWRIRAGTYSVMLSRSSRDVAQTVTVQVKGRTLPANWHPTGPGTQR